MLDEELIAARLYTGPMFEKYNGVLRGLNVKVFAAKMKEDCQGNLYVDTIHCINLCLLKLGKVVDAPKHVLVSGLPGILDELCGSCL